MVKSAVPQISVEALAARLTSSDPFILLDVRENWELKRAAIRDSRLQAQTPWCSIQAVRGVRIAEAEHADSLEPDGIGVFQLSGNVQRPFAIADGLSKVPRGPIELA